MTAVTKQTTLCGGLQVHYFIKLKAMQPSYTITDSVVEVYYMYVQLHMLRIVY